MKKWLDVDDRSAPAVARRMARARAVDAGLSEVRAEEAAIVASEMATNLIKHAGRGRFLAQLMPLPQPSVALAAIDEGPGIADPDRMLRDGESRQQSAGIGLGAMQRLSDRFDLFTRLGQGTIVTCEFSAGPMQNGPGLEIAGLLATHPLEDECGDAWFCRAGPNAFDLGLFDGLGHGPAAAAVAARAIAFTRDRNREPVAALWDLSKALARSRGAVGSLMRLSPAERRVDYANLGNIAALRRRGESVKRFAVRDGVIGDASGRPCSESERLAPGDLFIMHSDGIATFDPRTTPPILAGRSPLLIAGWLLHYGRRGRDDASVVVARWTP